MSMSADEQEVSDGSALPPFLTKLYELVETASAKHIEWCDEGATFRITNASLFAHDLLPLYFKHNSLASFTRQLLTYGFKRCHSPPGSGATLEFSHEHFRRGDRASLRLIRRRVASKKARGMVPGPYEHFYPPSATPTPPSAQPDNSLAYQMERLRDFVSTVERQLAGSMAEIKHQLAEMERSVAFAHWPHMGARPMAPVGAAPGVLQMVGVQGAGAHLDPAAAHAHQQAQVAQHTQQAQHAAQQAQQAVQHAAGLAAGLAAQAEPQGPRQTPGHHDTQHVQIASGLVRLSRGADQAEERLYAQPSALQRQRPPMAAARSLCAQAQWPAEQAQAAQHQQAPMAAALLLPQYGSCFSGGAFAAAVEPEEAAPRAHQQGAGQPHLQHASPHLTAQHI